MTLKTVYKYRLNQSTFGEGDNEIVVPRGAKFLSAQFQDEALCAWFLVDPEEKHLTVRVFTGIGTGHKFAAPVGTVHRGTFLLIGEKFVLHLFEKNPPQES